jgi:hypothetical protein
MVGWEGRPTEAAPVLLNLDEPSELEATLGLIRDVSPEDVVLARPRGLPRQVLDALQALKYSFEIPGTRDRTLEGWQDETEAEARAWAALRPTSDPTMGLLSKPGCTAGQAPALVLSTVNDQWFVQTEYGAHGLVGGAQLLRGTSVFFVAANTFDLFELVPLGRADRNTIGREWGLAAVDRTNPAGSGIIVDLKQRR